MYPYHNQIKKRINNGELIDIQDCENYKNIGSCKLLVFSSPPFTRPIRPERYGEYESYILEFKRKSYRFNNERR